MVCSACGFENQVGMRFCGMCGMPLPHRPLTTPGAQSTLNLTRVPIEGGAGRESSGSATSLRTSVLESSSGNGNTGTGEAHNSAITPVTDAPPPKELVPDVPLDEYIQKFHYEPPRDSAELTMRGDAAPAAPPEAELRTEPQVQAEVPVDVVPAAEIPDATVAQETKVAAKIADTKSAPATEKESSPLAETKPKPEVVAPMVLEDSVVKRLGLDPEGPAEEQARPRFLDLNEAPKEARPSTNSGTSTIVGPSFLGLSDAPAAAESAPLPIEEEEAPHNSHWRAWFATAIVLVFAALGVMEWRSQVYQTDNGPVQIIRTKLRNWRHEATAPANSEPAPATTASGEVNSKPDMQVQEQPKQSADASTATSNPPGVTSSPANTATTPPASTPAAAPPTTQAPAPNQTASSLAAPQKTAKLASKDQAASAQNASSAPPTIANSQSSASGGTTTPSNSAAKPPKRVFNNDDAATKLSAAAGADEMSKAKNASDSAAAAAWLWKATAKGNPDAPVQLADMYIKGDGVPRSCEQAIVLLKTAAEKENALARNRLASMYATGNCVQRNRVEAYRWLSSALTANPDSQWAQQNRELIWNQMTPDERAAAQKYR